MIICMPTAEQEGERVGKCEVNFGTHSCSHSEMDMKLPLLSQIDRVGKLCCSAWQCKIRHIYMVLRYNPDCNVD